MTLSTIRNPFLRRTTLVLTVLAVVICLGPLALVNAVLEWVEDEFEVDLRDVWAGK